MYIIRAYFPMIGEVNTQQGDVDSSQDEMRGGSIMFILYMALQSSMKYSLF